MTTDSTEHVILVPGFFGFTNLGDLPYFAHVESELQRAARDHDVRFEVSVVSTDPTASLPYRAARVAEHAAHLAGQGADRFHIVGHSTGGIDARLLVTPVVTLPTTVDVESVASKVRSVISVASPHRGTPLATVFGGRMGQSLLQLFSLTSIAILRRGRVPVYALLRLAGMLDRFRAGRRPNPSAMARLHDQLLADFSPERQEQIEGFLNKIRTDQGLLAQLTPESLEVFNASTPDRPGVRYGCAVTWGRPPGVGTAIKAGLDPYAQATHALYTAVYRLCRGTPARRREVRSPGQDGMLGAAYGVVPTWDASDGMVPTRSQVWGELVHATIADHLDVVGYFSDPHGEPPHYDWLASASGFDRPRFEAMWGDIARFIVDTRSPIVRPASSPGLLTAGRRAVAILTPLTPLPRRTGTPAPVDWPIAQPTRDDARDPWLRGAARRQAAPRRRRMARRALTWALAAAIGVTVHVYIAGVWSAVASGLAVVAVGEWSLRRIVPVSESEAEGAPSISAPVDDDPVAR